MSCFAQNNNQTIIFPEKGRDSLLKENYFALFEFSQLGK